MSRKYKCIYCNKSFERDKLSCHIEKEHSDMLNDEQGCTANRIVFDICNKKDPIGAGHGNCRICKKETTWNENLIRYNAYCSDACKAEASRIAKENMVKIYGKETLLNDIDWQNDKMLANRKIAGKYKWSDGSYKTYIGSYEKKFLEFCDVVLNLNSSDLITPGPKVEYEYNGEKHTWITDAIYLPYNLVFDIKDGGDNKNNRDMPEYRAKQNAKEMFISNDGKYNYIRLTNNQFDQLLEMFSELKLSYQESTNPETISKINEHTPLGAINPVTATSEPNLFITNYTKKNSFEKGWFVSNDILPDKVITVKKKKLKKMNGDELITNSECVVYRYTGDNVSSLLKEIYYNLINEIEVSDNYLPILLSEFTIILSDDQLQFSTLLEEVNIQSVIESYITNIESLKYNFKSINNKKEISFPVLDPVKYEYVNHILENYEDLSILQDICGKYFVYNKLNKRRTRSIDSIYDINEILINTVK